jgi:CRISPR-associated protein (TIGR02710 family)
MKKVLLVSVGGSPTPIVYSINHHKPDAVIYFCSRDSRSLIKKDIEPGLQHTLIDSDKITTPDEQNLFVSVQKLVSELPQVLADMGLGFEHLQADFTGGTKAMAAAVVLALADRGCNYSYVGGVGRDKAGLGVVLDGREQLLYSDNPWDALGREPLKLFALHFNRCRFVSATDVARRAAERTDRLKPLFDTLAKLAEGYGRWDDFDYKGAGGLLNPCRTPLRTLPGTEDGRELTRVFAAVLEDDLERLDSVKNDMQTMEGKSKTPSDGRALLLDLLANAVRRAEREHKYDDAVARLYSVIEKMAKIRLSCKYKINNSAVSEEDIPAAKREAILLGYSPDEKGLYKIPLHRSYLLLEALGDSLGEKYRTYEGELEKVLNIRNNSLLAHGYTLIKEATYRKLLQIALAFCGLDQENLPAFPKLPEK